MKPVNVANLACGRGAYPDFAPIDFDRLPVSRFCSLAVQPFWGRADSLGAAGRIYENIFVN